MQRTKCRCKKNATVNYLLQIKCNANMVVAKMQRLNRRCKKNTTLNYSLHTNVAKLTMQPINFFATSCLTMQNWLCNQSTFLQRCVWRCKIDFATNHLFCIVTFDVAKLTLQPINFFATSCLTMQNQLCNQSTFLQRYVWRCKIDFATN